LALLYNTAIFCKKIAKDLKLNLTQAKVWNGWNATIDSFVHKNYEVYQLFTPTASEPNKWKPCFAEQQNRHDLGTWMPKWTQVFS